VIAAYWRDGDLGEYLLHETQEAMRSAICASIALLFVLNCARRLGKSYLSCVLAIEQCLQRPASRVLYIADTGKRVRTIIAPLMKQILLDCPADMMPTLNQIDGIWKFPNGSEIHIVGVNNGHEDDARGGGADLVIIDEAATIDALTYIVESVVKPMLLTTDGRIIMVSTPAQTPAHAYTGYCARAQAANAYAGYTIYDAPHIPRERADRFIAEGGGRGATYVRREYFVEHVVDESVAVFPEWRDDLVEARTVPHYVPVIVGDAGFHDLTFIVGGFHDFKHAIDVIEWEVVTSKMLAKDIDTAVSAEAVAHWGPKLAKEARRHIDAPAQTVAELGTNNSAESEAVARLLGKPAPLRHGGWSGIAKVETDGPFMGAAVNSVRQRMKDRTIRVHPRCTSLVAHIKYGVWKDPGRDFARMEGFGHFDGAAAISYFDRLVDRRTNPWPAMVALDAWEERDDQISRLKRLGGRR
jgi:hypothetical protein